MRILHLYRPRLPGQRAQAIQVVHACEAFARRGHTVTLLADRGEGDLAECVFAEAATPFGLTLPEGFELQIAPTAHPGLAGLWFRAGVARWWWGPPGGVVYARDKRRLRELLRFAAATGSRGRHRVVLEAHELDQALAAEGGRPTADIAALERDVLSGIDALVTNCGGTMRAWEVAWGPRLPAARRVVHNATAPSRRREAVAEPEPVVRCVGGLRRYKGPDLLRLAAATLPFPVELVGGEEAERSAVGEGPGGLRLRPPVAFTAVPDLLARSRVLVLPLKDNLFGRELTSPLKLWDYLATAVPIVAPDLPTVREIAALTGAQLHTHRPGDPIDLARAIMQAWSASPRSPTLRSWGERATEIEALLGIEPLLEGEAP